MPPIVKSRSTSVGTIGFLLLLLAGCGDDAASIIVTPAAGSDAGSPTDSVGQDAGDRPLNEPDPSWCPPGRYVVNPAAAPTERICAPCPSETFSDKGDSTHCTPWTTCAPGSVPTAAPSAESDRTCLACDIGTFAQPEWGACVECPSGTWDHDANPGTACEAWTSCPVNTFVTSTPSAVDDRVCAPCPAGTHSTLPNSAACNTCQPGEYVDSLTANQQVVCKSCPGDTFSTTVNAGSCTARTICPIGSYVTALPTPGSDRVCAPCPAGAASTGINALTCGSVTALSAGANQTCAVLADGQVWCWGETSVGATTLTPTRVENLTDVSGVAVGAGFGCAVQASGTVQCWGDNAEGQLGDGTMTSRPTPALVSGLPDVTRISVYGAKVYALGQDGAVFTWGGGQSLATALSASGAADLSPSLPCAVEEDGSVRCWDLISIESGQPLPPAGFANVRKLARRAVNGGAWGHEDTCALRANGSIVCEARWWDAWGPHAPGWYTLPQEIGQTLDDVVLADDRICALSSGDVRCWIYDVYGFGLGTPVLPGVSDALALTGSPRHLCALSIDGSVRCWGANDHGQLGDKTTTDRPSAVTLQW